MKNAKMIVSGVAALLITTTTLLLLIFAPTLLLQIILVIFATSIFIGATALLTSLIHNIFFGPWIDDSRDYQDY